MAGFQPGLVQLAGESLDHWLWYQAQFHQGARTMTAKGAKKAVKKATKKATARKRPAKKATKKAPARKRTTRRR